MTNWTKKPYRKDAQKQLMLDRIKQISYIRHGARLHENKQGADRWSARLQEAINISFMLKMLTDEEIYNAIRSGEEEREKEN